MSGSEQRAAGTAPDDGENLHGRRFDDVAPAERARILALAFDYRGDVTLALADGSRLTGYVFSHHPQASEPYLRLFPADRDVKVSVRYADVVGIEFSGPDKATGRSWRAWVARYEEKQRLQSQGVEVGDVEPQPESLD